MKNIKDNEKLKELQESVITLFNKVEQPEKKSHFKHLLIGSGVLVVVTAVATVVNVLVVQKAHKNKARARGKELLDAADNAAKNLDKKAAEVKNKADDVIDNVADKVVDVANSTAKNATKKVNSAAKKTTKTIDAANKNVKKAVKNSK